MGDKQKKTLRESKKKLRLCGLSSKKYYRKHDNYTTWSRNVQLDHVEFEPLHGYA